MEISYSTQSELTKPLYHEHYYSELPSAPLAIKKVVTNLLVYDPAVTSSLRVVSQILDVVFSLNSSSILNPRENNEKYRCSSREFNLLLVSFLRSKGIPARCRVSFINRLNFKGGVWVTQYFKVGWRWLKLIEILGGEINDSHLHTAGEAWQFYKINKLEAKKVNINNSLYGLPAIGIGLLNDINCLLKQEVLPFDLWTDISTKKYLTLKGDDVQFWEELLDLSKQADESSLLLLADTQLKAYWQQNDYHLERVLAETDSPIVNPNELERKLEFTLADQLDYVEEKVKPAKNKINLKGCRENNLKNINVELLRNKINVITGVSGSGKSSLAFDTIYAEGIYSYMANFGNLSSNKMRKPVVDEVIGLTPTLGLKQNYFNSQSRSTLGSLSKINNSLRELFVLLGIPHCPFCGSRLQEKTTIKNRCEVCDYDYPTLKTSSFNANTPLGACRTCRGKGELYLVNPYLIIEDEDLSIIAGATKWWGKLENKKSKSNWNLAELHRLADYYQIDLTLPWNQLPKEFIEVLLFGSDGKTYPYTYTKKDEVITTYKPIKGIKEIIDSLYQASKVKEEYLKYMEKQICPNCEGEKLSIEGRYTTLGGYRFGQLLSMPISAVFCFLEALEIPVVYKKIIQEIKRKIQKKIFYLDKIGLSYLGLERPLTTLSSGEIQRIKLINQVTNNQLSNITYIFDEPTSGLHPKDKEGIKRILITLKERENTLVVVEHDREMMKIADRIIELGLGAGKKGGEVIALGSSEELKQTPQSLIGSYLNRLTPPLVSTNQRLSTEKLHLVGCQTNNLKDITLSLPMNAICCITGVSGSGKTSLVFGTLLPALAAKLENKELKNKTYRSLVSEQTIEKMVVIDHKKIGRTKRSSIASYLKIFDIIRILFEETTLAKERSLSRSFFSANSVLGQCPYCKGLGKILPSGTYIDQSYICPQCNGSKYSAEILSVQYNSKTIVEILELTVVEALDFFEKNKTIFKRLSSLKKVGLSYLKLGTSTSTLSGGEAQRLKLSRELVRNSKKSTIFLLDEPTSGLHYLDVENLMKIFQELKEQGQTIVIVEHNVEIIRNVDWVVDLGPAGDSQGGQIIAEGSPFEINNNPNSSYYQLL